MQTYTLQAQGEKIGSTWACGNKTLSENTSRVWYYWSEKHIVILYLAFHLNTEGPQITRAPGPPRPHITRALGPPRPHITSVIGPPRPHISSDMGPGGPRFGGTHITRTPVNDSRRTWLPVTGALAWMTPGHWCLGVDDSPSIFARHEWLPCVTHTYISVFGESLRFALSAFVNPSG